MDFKMSGKPKNGWGGKRTGSGQKKKPQARPIEAPAPSMLSKDELAKMDADLARATLRHIAMEGVTEAARVAAARELWDRAEGKVGAVKPTEGDTAKPADKWGQMLDEARPN